MAAFIDNWPTLSAEPSLILAYTTMQFVQDTRIYTAVTFYLSFIGDLSVFRDLVLRPHLLMRSGLLSFFLPVYTEQGPAGQNRLDSLLDTKLQ